MDPLLQGVSKTVGDTGVESDTKPVADIVNGATDDQGVGSEVFGAVNGIVARQVEGGNGDEDINVDNPVAVLVATGGELLDGLATVVS